MRGYQLTLFLAILAIGTVVWPGCSGSPAPPADSGTVIEDESELPGAGEPYTIEKLDGQKGEAGDASKTPQDTAQ